MGECRQQIYLQHAQSTETECDYVYGWIKSVTYAKLSPGTGEPQIYSWEGRRRRMVNPRDIVGERRRRRMVNPRDIAGKAEEEWGTPEI